MQTDEKTTQALEQIAKANLGIATLKSAKNDEQDFHTLGVWEIAAALRAAYELGKAGK